MKDKKQSTDNRPLWVRLLSTFLALWIAVSVTQCASNDSSNANANADSSYETEQTSDDANGADTADNAAGKGESAEGKTGLGILSFLLPDDESPGEGSGEDANEDTNEDADSDSASATSNPTSNLNIPAYSGNASAQVNGNVPAFDATLIEKAERGSFEDYWPLDSLGRATGAVVCAGLDTMPEGERGSIGDVRPTGFHLTRYDWVDGKYLYNRCHLIGWQLTGENANTRNLITGTRSMNVEGMLPYENQIDDYIESTGNHVLYRATPIYEGGDLVARGVLLEARSVEDDGRGLSFCVFCYNVEPGVTIDYATGASSADGTMQEEDLVDETKFDYILNTNTKRIHYPSCSSVDDMKEKNKQGFNGTVEEAEAMGYVPCGRCNP